MLPTARAAGHHVISPGGVLSILQFCGSPLVVPSDPSEHGRMRGIAFEGG